MEKVVEEREDGEEVVRGDVGVDQEKENGGQDRWRRFGPKVIEEERNSDLPHNTYYYRNIVI